MDATVALWKQMLAVVNFDCLRFLHILKAKGNPASFIQPQQWESRNFKATKSETWLAHLELIVRITLKKSKT